MPDQPMRTRLLAVPVALVAATLVLLVTGASVLDAAGAADALTVQAGASVIQAGASVFQAGGLPAGPAQVSPLGHPRLCWEAWGDGSSITLEPCDSSLQGQEWTFTGNGVLMNGNGYCLQDGGPAQGGDALYLSFSGQCAGATSQQWTFNGATNTVKNAPGDLCAYVQGSGLAPGAEIVGRRCGGSRSWGAWSQGVSDLALSVPREGSGPSAAGGAGMAGTAARRAFAAEVTVSNPASAMTAYAASVFVRPPRGLTVTSLAGTGSLSGWACAVRTLECRGNLGGGASGRITIAGTVAGRPAADVIAVHATVSHTNQARHAALTAAVQVRIYTVAADGTARAGVFRGMLTGSTAGFVLIVAVLLVALGIVLAVVTRRRRRPVRAHARPRHAAMSGRRLGG